MHTISDQTADVRPEHRRAVVASAQLVKAVTADDLDRPTPCTGWNVRELLAHMTAQHRGFAAAARGHGDDLAVWQADPAADDPVGDYLAASKDVLRAFVADSVLERQFALPEFGAKATFPGARAIGFHLIDYVAHGWDVARATRQQLSLDDDTVDLALELALEVPDDHSRTRAGAAFKPAVITHRDSPLDQFLAHLGRNPDWMPLAR